MLGSRDRSLRTLIAAGVIGLVALPVPRARADESSAVDQIVSVLREKGLIDAATGDEILAKQAQAEAEKSAKPLPSVSQGGLLDGFIFSGDLRLRDEQFWYSSGMGADGANDNNRFRYRLRIGFTKEITPWALIGVRLVTGTGDYRSTNVSVGENSNFSYDSVFFDRVYAQFALPDPGDIGLKSTVVAGKMQNPFIWTHGLDRMIWDDDITPEGVAMTNSYSPTENSKLWVNSGLFIELQNANHTDPRVWAIQAGGSVKLPETFEVGARVSYYDWLALQNDSNSAGHVGFIGSSEGLGNLSSAFNPDMEIMESSGYVTWGGIAKWPVTFWGTWAQNLAAQAAVIAGVRVGSNDTAFGYGVEVGDAKAIVRLGLAWDHVEANAVPALYTDSDMFDGQTNRQGWAFYGAREIATNTEVRLWLWDKQPIKTTASGTGTGPFNISTATNSQTDRYRLQADLNFKF